ncbi:MAG: hypothetical protein K0V04_38640 [Deltaproteobacteria bacterium]|nr:hypothetical protein [Deltaproteobacteria bacterium]
MLHLRLPLLTVLPLAAGCLFNPTAGALDGTGTETEGSSGSAGASSGEDESTSTGAVDGTETDAPPPSGPDAFDPHFRSGSRLQAEVFRDESGPLTLHDVWDASLQTPCDFLVASDGVERCLPRTLDYTPMFTTPDCSGPPVYVSWSPCAQPPSMIVGPTEGACGAGAVEVYEAVEAPLPTEPLYIGGDGYCDATGAVADGQAFVRGGRVDPAEFVAVERRVELNADGLGVEVVEGDEGSRFVAAMANADETRCAARTMVSDEAERCVTMQVAYHESFDWWFGDDGCEAEPLAYGYTKGCDQPPDLVLEVELGKGSPRYSLATLGEELTEGSVYSGAPGECLASPLSEVPWSIFRIGEPLPDDTAPLVVREVEPGPGMGLNWYRAETGEHLRPVPDAPLHDDAVGPCLPQPRGDGTFLCVPASAVGAGEVDYVDPGCTEPVMAFGPDFVDKPPSFAVEWGPGECAEGGSGIVAVWSTANAYAGPFYYGEPGACFPAGEDVEPGTYRVVPESVDVLPSLTIERLR